MDNSEHRFVTHFIKDGVTVLTFTKSMLNAEAVNEAIAVINAGENRNVIFDFQAVLMFHNPITRLVLLHKRLTEERGRMVLCNVHPDLAQIFQITRLNQLFEIQPGISSALASMRKQP